MKTGIIITTITFAAAGMMFGISPVNAALIKHVFEGDITHAFDNTSTIDFTAVNSYSGMLVYETTTAESSSSSTDTSVGDYPSAIKEFTITLGSSEFSLLDSSTSKIQVFNRSWDILQFYADLVGPGAIGTRSAKLELTDQDALAFTNDALPSSVHLSDFNTPVRLILGNSADSFYVNGTPLTRFEPVPEPVTLTLMGLGLAGMGFMRNWRT